MPLQIVRDDITKMKVDAIVNPANERLLSGGGVDGEIHRAAGPRLLKACEKLNGCRAGEAKITKGYRLSASYVIHTVGPVWKGGDSGEREILISCYRSCLELAKEKRCKSIAFPLLSSGVNGYPKAEALQTAVNTITEFLMQNDMSVYIVVFDRKAVEISESLFANVQRFIDDNYVTAQIQKRPSRIENIAPVFGNRNINAPSGGRAAYKKETHKKNLSARNDSAGYDYPEYNRKPDSHKPDSYKSDSYKPEVQEKEEELCEVSLEEAYSAVSLEDALNHIDESFSQMLLRKIDEAGIKDSECYKQANIDRKLFSKIRGNVNYKPSKQTAVAFAIALKLPLEETKEMLMKAGYALSHSSKFDIIIEYFILQKKYNIFEINETLFAFDQPLLGN